MGMVNCMALSFILSIDEMIVSSHALYSQKVIMEKLEEFDLYDTQEDEQFENDEVLRQYGLEMLRPGIAGYVDGRIIPWRLSIMLGLTFFFVMGYYVEKC